jgi:hypothetical protein
MWNKNKPNSPGKMSQFLRFSNFVQKSAGEDLSGFIISLNVTFSRHDKAIKNIFLNKNHSLTYTYFYQWQKIDPGQNTIWKIEPGVKISYVNWPRGQFTIGFKIPYDTGLCISNLLKTIHENATYMVTNGMTIHFFTTTFMTSVCVFKC